MQGEPRAHPRFTETFRRQPSPASHGLIAMGCPTCLHGQCTGRCQKKEKKKDKKDKKHKKDKKKKKHKKHKKKGKKHKKKN